MSKVNQENQKDPITEFEIEETNAKCITFENGTKLIVQEAQLLGAQELVSVVTADDQHQVLQCSDGKCIMSGYLLKPLRDNIFYSNLPIVYSGPDNPGLYGLMDHQFNVIVKPQFLKIECLGYIYDCNQPCDRCLTVVDDTGKYGLIIADKEQKTVLECEYEKLVEKCLCDCEGAPGISYYNAVGYYVIAKKNGKYGLLRIIHGKVIWIVPIQYNQIRFHKFPALVWENYGLCFEVQDNSGVWEQKQFVGGRLKNASNSAIAKWQ